MYAPTKTSKDTLLMSALIVAGFGMAALAPLFTSAEADAAVKSASDAVQSVWTPAAMQPILHREAAIIVTAPRNKTVI